MPNGLRTETVVAASLLVTSILSSARFATTLKLGSLAVRLLSRCSQVSDPSRMAILESTIRLPVVKGSRTSEFVRPSVYDIANTAGKSARGQVS